LERRYRTNAEKLRIVQESMAEGVSMAAVARQHGVNSDLLFNWRRRYRSRPRKARWRARSSMHPQDDALVVGAWPLAVLGIWGSGLIFESNPYDPQGFQAGITQARVLLTATLRSRYRARFQLLQALHDE
jgi:hypothetical protein